MKTAFVTGGSGGIGSEICRTLASEGWAVAIGYCKNKGSALKLCDEIRVQGFTALAVFCDITNTSSIHTAIDTIASELGDIQLLVNNAGTAKIGLFTDLSDDEIMHLTGENLTGSMLLTKAVLPSMVRNQFGKIVNISSVWGEVGASCEVVYSAAKAGLIGFTKALAKEVAPSGINVNCISAGLIDTPMNSELSEDDLQAVIDEIPAGRMGTPQDIANAVSFLVSDKSSYINGQVIRVDGAWC